jgi:7-cyano-7-deazaguanine synthase in queuosine biosynthesis
MFLSCVSNKVRAFDTPPWAIALGEIDQFGALSAFEASDEPSWIQNPFGFQSRGLESSGEKSRACIVSHRSQPGTMRTQRQLAGALERLFPDRVSVTHYTFDCVLHGQRAVEETQRSRVFLYVSIAFALARALSQSQLFVYANGITALNFARRQDLLKARASRTTHPKTIRLLNDLLSEVSGDAFTIRSPFLWMTKTDVMERLVSFRQRRLLTSSVSCSKTFQNMQRETTHCGICSQCVDRRFAAYASGLDDVDESGLYGNRLHWAGDPRRSENGAIGFCASGKRICRIWR